MRTLVVIPTYNESGSIERLLRRVLKVAGNLQVLVVDDSSPDGTASLVRQFAESEPRVHLLLREKKEGIGPAYRAGFRWALERDFDLVMEMDADFSHRPRYIPVFLEEAKSSDVVCGSRWMKGGRIVNWSLGRILLSRFANLYSKIILGISIHDMTTGYVLYHRKVLQELNLDTIKSDGYSFQIEMKYRALRKGFKLTEIPIRFADRQSGSSKISKWIVIEAFIMVWRLRFT